MAAPITHIALTEKIFDKFFKDKKRKDFFIGTLFPDIRYLKITRDSGSRDPGSSPGPAARKIFKPLKDIF